MTKVTSVHKNVQSVIFQNLKKWNMFSKVPHALTEIQD